MEKYIPMFKKTQLFAGIGEGDIRGMLGCLGSRLATYKKGEYLLRQGEHLGEMLMVAEGSLLVQQDDYWGNRSILTSIDVGEMFGEGCASPAGNVLLNDVVAAEDSTVIFFNVQKMLTTCSSACRFHTMVIQNLFYAISEKNRKLMQKLTHISKRTTREKLISYLSEEAKKQNSAHFTIPFNRQQLADFLSVDRSAMSAELGKMRDEGLLEFDRNWFRLR